MISPGGWVPLLADSGRLLRLSEGGTGCQQIQDENGNRLYATFIRFQLEATCALASFKENERVELDATTSRYGTGIYFSDARASGEPGSIRARLASSFSRVEAEGSNTSLVRGMPEIPTNCNIP